jgi:ribose-phosphate pyrophosphokinase
MARAIADASDGGEVGCARVREFPDGETYVRIETPVAGRDVWIVCTMHPVRDKFWSAHYLAATARDLGATRVGLIAPYLAYMRQDSRFHDGEGVTASYFAGLLSSTFDALVTVDPHLHRVDSLDRIYAIPATAVSAAAAISAWIRSEIESPVLVGPDEESAQWVERVAIEIDCPRVVLRKHRRGDRDVSVSALEPADHTRFGGRTPVLIDDIVSTGHTMVEAITRLSEAGLPAPVCVGIHAVLAEGALERVCAAGARRLVTCNTISHPTNVVDVAALIARALVDARVALMGAMQPTLVDVPRR